MADPTEDFEAAQELIGDVSDQEPPSPFDNIQALLDAPADVRDWGLRKLVEKDPVSALRTVFPECTPTEAYERAERYKRLRADRYVRRMLDEEEQLANQDELPELVEARLVAGGSFVLDIPDGIPSVWGAGNRVVWAEGESLTLAGPPGVGKTTLAGQAVRGRLQGGSVLGMRVTPTASKVLYLAMDRPQQIARSLRRTLSDVDREVLDARLVAWPGPPLQDVADAPETLLAMAREAGADTIVVDSIKDAAVGLSDDRVGAGYNRARQTCLANGVEVLEVHHMVKKGENGAEPTSLAHVYGSNWITAGSGSVVLLWGQAGDPIVRWSHLKQPAEEVGPYWVEHDHLAGTSTILDAVDLVKVVRAATKDGLTAKDAARVLFETAKPTPAQVAKARRRLDALVRKQFVGRIDGSDAEHRATVWVAPELVEFSETEE